MLLVLCWKAAQKNKAIFCDLLKILTNQTEVRFIIRNIREHIRYFFCPFSEID